MAKTILNKLNALIIGCIIITYFNSCNGQSKNIDNCILHLKNARRNLNIFYKSNEQSLLTPALNEVEQSMQCDKTKRGAIELKLTLFLIIKKYEAGHRYVDSVNENDFVIKYKKLMWRSYFLALEYESRLDTLNRNKLLNSIIFDIQNFIQQEGLPKNKLNEEAYYDLFTVKRKVLSPQQIIKELDSLKKKYPNERYFFDALKQSLIEDPKVVSPSR